MALVTRPDGQPRGTQPPVLTTVERNAVQSPGQGELLVVSDPQTTNAVPVTTSQELQVFLARQGDPTVAPNPDPTWQTVMTSLPVDNTFPLTPVVGGFQPPSVAVATLELAGARFGTVGAMVRVLGTGGTFTDGDVLLSLTTVAPITNVLNAKVL